MSTVSNGFNEGSGVDVYWGFNSDPLVDNKISPKGNVEIDDLNSQGNYWTFEAKNDQVNKEPIGLTLTDFVPHHSILIEYDSNDYKWKITAGSEIPPGTEIQLGNDNLGQTTANIEIGPKT